MKLTLAKEAQVSERTHEVSEARLRPLADVISRVALRDDQQTLNLIEATCRFKSKLAEKPFHRHRYELIEVANDILYQIQKWYWGKRKGAENHAKLPRPTRLKLEKILSEFKRMYDNSDVIDGVRALPDGKERLMMEAKLNLWHTSRIGFKHLPRDITTRTRARLGNALINMGKIVRGEQDNSKE